jgi:ABC-type transport system substrate-binding protein
LATSDNVVRKPLYDRLQEITAEQSWLVMLGFWQQFWALSSRVQGFKPAFNGIGYFGDVSLSG